MDYDDTEIFKEINIINEKASRTKKLRYFVSNDSQFQKYIKHLIERKKRRLEKLEAIFKTRLNNNLSIIIKNIKKGVVESNMNHVLEKHSQINQRCTNLKSKTEEEIMVLWKLL